MNQTLSQVASLIGKVSPDLTFDAANDAHTDLTDLGMDSLDNMSLFLEVQEHYKLGEIPDADIDRLTTASEIVDYIEQRVA